jgi:hypothetical protein
MVFSWQDQGSPFITGGETRYFRTAGAECRSSGRTMVLHPAFYLHIHFLYMYRENNPIYRYAHYSVKITRNYGEVP